MHECSQLISICSAVNGHLIGRFSVDHFFPEHIDFRHCKAVVFAKQIQSSPGQAKELEIASNPNLWIKSLAAGGATKAFLYPNALVQRREADHVYLGYAGHGGPWSLCIAYPNRIDRWLTRSETVELNPSSDRDLLFRFVLDDSLPALPFSAAELPQADLDGATELFLSALAENTSFCARHYLAGFASTFQRAAAMLNSRRRSSLTFPDNVDFICLDCYPEKAQRLFGACYCAGVISGMRDLWFADPNTSNEHSEILGRLLVAIDVAVQHAVLSFITP